MTQPHVDDVVRLLHDVPDLGLSRGQVGVVRSTWLAPVHAYEVEFSPKGLDQQTRVLLLGEQIVLAETLRAGAAA